jgi:23S rRNA pseudouridine1911/1915/1917 synthase
MTLTFTADRGDAGRRLDHVLRRHLQRLDIATRTRVQTWIREGRVTINGVAARRAAARTDAGDVIGVEVTEAARRSHAAPEDLPVDILYEDDDLIVVNKAAGIVVHPTYAHPSGTMLNALLWRARDWPSGQRPSIVGRLDKFTSGLVVAAKSPDVHARLQRALHSPRAEKLYLAVVYGRVRANRGTIDRALARAPGDRRRVVASAGGAPSVTRFEALSRVAAPRAGLAVLRCRLMTGRMHQIRVHLASRGWPIVGDAKYGEPRWQQVIDPDLAAILSRFPRQALHAWRLVFDHPSTRQRLTVESPVPPDIAALASAAGLDCC